MTNFFGSRDSFFDVWITFFASKTIFWLKDVSFRLEKRFFVTRDQFFALAHKICVARSIFIKFFIFQSIFRSRTQVLCREIDYYIFEAIFWPLPLNISFEKRKSLSSFEWNLFCFFKISFIFFVCTQQILLNHHTNSYNLEVDISVFIIKKL